MRFTRNGILKAMDTFTTWGTEHGCYLHMDRQDKQGKQVRQVRQVLTVRPMDETLMELMRREPARPPAYLQFNYQGKIVAQYGEGSPIAVENLEGEFTEDDATQIVTAKETFEGILSAIPSFHRYLDFMDDLSMREQLEGRMVQADREEILRFLLPQQMDEGLAMILVVDPNGFNLQLEVYMANK